MPSAQYNFSPEGKTFIARDNSFAGLEIGDIKQKNFFPQFKLRRWGKNQDESNVSFRLGGVLLDQETNPQISQSGNKISWAGEKTQVDFYDTGGLKEETGGYEMDITLLVKPASPIIPVTLNVPKNLDIFYQPPLTADEIKEGSVRPDKVVGSYALYHKTMAGDYSAFGLDNYKAGKFGHIYRPWLIDANGRRVWGDLNIDVRNQLLTVTIPQDFFNSCAWPVHQAAGLEFGYHVAGGSSNWFGSTATLSKAASNPAQDGNLTSIYVYCKSDKVSDSTVALYDNSSSKPNNRLTQTTPGPAVGSDMVFRWIKTSISPPYSITKDTVYWLGFGDSAGRSKNVAYDTGSGSSGRLWNYYTFETPAGAIYQGIYNYLFSIYGEFTTAGGAMKIPYHLFLNQPKGVF
jgi:hypothetical protein